MNDVPVVITVGVRWTNKPGSSLQTQELKVSDFGDLEELSQAVASQLHEALIRREAFLLSVS